MFQKNRSYRDQTVLITGAGGGFGRLFAEQFLRDGARVILSDRAPIDLGSWGAEFSLKDGWTSQVLGQVTLDLSTPDAGERLVEEAEKLAPIDVAILNAGLLALGYHEDIPVERMHLLMDVMLRGPMTTTHALLPWMKQRGHGQLVYICSVAGFIATPYAASYTAAKFGLRGFAMSIAGEAGDAGVDVSLVYPFFTHTGILKSPRFGNAVLPKMADWMVDQAPAVVDEAMRGIRRRKLHVRTGKFSKLMWEAARLKPWIVKHKGL